MMFFIFGISIQISLILIIVEQQTYRRKPKTPLPQELLFRSAERHLATRRFPSSRKQFNVKSLAKIFSTVQRRCYDQQEIVLI